jgi:anoctamin-10
MSSTTTSEGLLLFNELNQKQASGSVLDKSADYIIRFNFQPPNGKKLKEAGNDYRERVTGSYRLVIARLTSAGLEYEVRRVGPTRLFIFVICPRERLRQQYDRSRVQDWISGVNSAAFIEQDANMNEQLMADATSFDTISTATRLRLVHDIITGPISEGCAAISVEEDPFVEAIYPLHDRKFNEALLKKWATKWFITQDDLLEIRNHFGENIAYYFEFLQFYFIWLSAPSLVGLLVYFYDAGFTVYYAMFNVLWSLLFVEMWRRREQELATWWSVRNCSKLERRRSGFQPDRIIVDAVTGEPTPYYPSWKRWMRRLVTFPILAAIGAVFFIVVGAIFAIEVFVYEYYQGPFKDIVVSMIVRG